MLRPYNNNLKFKAMLTIEKKSLKVGKFVNTEHVNTVIRNYKQERWVHNSRRIGKEDSLSIWYSIEELEEFLAKAKDHGGDGVRFYFGAYDKDCAPQELYQDRQTIVMVATKQKETMKGIIDKDLYTNNGEETTILAYNAGRPCPPLCKPDEEFGGIGITIVDKGEGDMVIV
jgi:hypothetical protein